MKNKLPEKLNVTEKDGYLFWHIKKSKKIRENMFAAEAGVLILAEKYNQLIDYLKERETLSGK